MAMFLLSRRQVNGLARMLDNIAQNYVELREVLREEEVVRLRCDLPQLDLVHLVRHMARDLVCRRS